MCVCVSLICSVIVLLSDISLSVLLLFFKFLFSYSVGGRGRYGRIESALFPILLSSPSSFSFFLRMASNLLPEIQLKDPEKEFEILKQIGSGGYGVVYKVSSIGSNEICISPELLVIDTVYLYAFITFH